MIKNKITVFIGLILIFPFLNLKSSFSETSHNEEKSTDIKIEKKVEQNKKVNRQIFFINEKNSIVDINSLDLVSGEIKKIFDKNVDLSKMNYGLSWSPDCSTFAIELKEGNSGKEQYYKYIWNPKTSKFIKIPIPSIYSSAIKWSKDSSKLIFLVSKDEVDKKSKWAEGIYVVNKDGSNLKLIGKKLDSESDFYQYYDWFPDNTKIFYSLDNYGNPKTYYADLNGKRIDISKKIRNDFIKPKISPDGKKIIFTKIFEKGSYIMNSDGSNVKNLIKDSIITLLSWSPDGKNILVEKLISENKTSLELVTINNLTIIKRVPINIPIIIEGTESWSSDSLKIAFIGPVKGVKPVKGLLLTKLYVLDLSTKKIINVSQNLKIYSFDWSPDGKSLVFNSPDNKGIIDLYTVEYNGNNLIKLANSENSESFPTWKP